ncbi:MAG: PLDc N-terminal domain-containing protein [Thermodesulfobacteriota bacterium]
MNKFELIIAAGAVFYALTCLAFLDIARKDFGSLARKVLWGIVAFIPFIGVVVYFLFGYRRGKRPGAA